MEDLTLADSVGPQLDLRVDMTGLTFTDPTDPQVGREGLEDDQNSNDGFEDDEPQNGHQASNAGEMKRAHKATFEKWLASASGQQALTSKAKTSDGKDISTLADEEMSIQSLMQKQGDKIIKNPREYQRELCERAKQQNTIAVLDTGSGKTLIAVMLIRWVIDQELESRAAGNRPKVAFFLVASVTLVYQQFSVLTTNLDHPIARVCGADNADNWNRLKWTKLFDENKVIICTADILLACLHHSYITMDQINLLVFDEAHHAKKNHAYARIIKDFYVDAPSSMQKPRVFGMTASPIDAKTDVWEAASELETLLDSRIATTTDMSFTEAVKRPTEHVISYDALPQPFETQLLRATKASFGHIEVFVKVFEECPGIARELGSWCADQYLTERLSEKNMKGYADKLERKFFARRMERDVRELDDAVAEVRAAIAFVTGWPRPQRIKRDDMSSKVWELHKFLRREFELPTNHKAIVFVSKRYSARLLDTLFKRVGTPHMKSAFLVGNNSDSNESNFSFRQQVMTLIKFRKDYAQDDHLNCLFATSVAEEGLDVPDCNLVVRFDVVQTMIQYVQSRGRARHGESKFIHMMERGNSLHTYTTNEVRQAEMQMRYFCQKLPEDRRLVGNEDTLEALMSKEKALRVYTEPSTGAKLTYGNALAYLAHFVSAIPNPENEELHPTYIVNSTGMKFKAEAILPASAPLHSAIGRTCVRKSLAKRSAAFEACLQLRQKGYMNEYFMPIYQKKLRAMAHALLAVNMDKSNMYLMLTKPRIWKHARGTLPQDLWMTVVDFPDGLKKEHQPLVLLTRTKMPEFPSFPVFLDDGRQSQVVTHQVRQGLHVDQETLGKLSKFTYRIFHDVFSKKYEEDDAQLSYWLAPGNTSAGKAVTADPIDAINWSMVDEVAENDGYRWSPEMSNDALVNRFIVDPTDGSRKFCSLAVHPDKKPTDPVPEDAAKYKHMDDILNYSVSLFKKSRANAKWNYSQPVVKAELFITRRNMLATPELKETKLRTTAYVCPEPLRISPLTPAVATSCFVWPAVIYRFEAYLIALEACSMLGIECSTATALAAVTKDSDNSGEHEETERINFQKGMGENYERLEFIGDTFLKTSTTISTFIENPNDDEFDFHVKRMQMLCNKNLFKNALDLELYQYVRSQAFSRRLWYPEGMQLLEGKGATRMNENGEVVLVVQEEKIVNHSLGEKTIADVCEALIGAAFISNDKPDKTWHEDQWANAVRAVTKLVGSEGHTMDVWNDYRLAYDKPYYQTGDVTASIRDLAQKVEKEHPYHFNYPRLLRSAFLHPSESRMAEGVPNYQRLEFLGDALLDMASISYLFYAFPGKDPQWLTEHKMAMVSNKFLGAVCVNAGFHRHLRYASPILEPQIRAYAEELLEAKRTSSGARDYWTTVSDPPKCLPDIVESYVGAIFIDSDFDYQVVRDFFERHIKWYFEDMSVYDTFANNHPCTHLHNLLQTSFGCMDYRLMARELPTTDGVEMERKDVIAVVIVHGEVVAYSKGKSGRYARIRVGNDARKMLEGLNAAEFRGRFGCNCRVGEMAEKGKMGAGPGAGMEIGVGVDCAL